MRFNPYLSSQTLQQWHCPQCNRVCTLAPGLPLPQVCAECWNEEVGIHLLDTERIAQDYFRLDGLSTIVQTLIASQGTAPEWLVRELVGMWERTCGDSCTVPKPGSRLMALHEEIQTVSYDQLAMLGLDVWAVHEQYRTYDNYWRKQQLIVPPSNN
ncbi:MAG: hypothetical protein H7338_22040 [Candidatus Sericytochromatia bacterium]|nr:hypothetical protein [Candidatus Sericytochromatia bacterium]